MLTLITLPERIFRTRIGTKEVVVLSCQEYINEACDERRFHKSIKMSLGVRDNPPPPQPTPFLRRYSFPCRWLEKAYTMAYSL